MSPGPTFFFGEITSIESGSVHKGCQKIQSGPVQNAIQAFLQLQKINVIKQKQSLWWCKFWGPSYKYLLLSIIPANGYEKFECDPFPVLFSASSDISKILIGIRLPCPNIYYLQMA
jgi:hypothetical protein